MPTENRKPDIRSIATDSLVGMIAAVTRTTRPANEPLPSFIQAPVDRAVDRIRSFLTPGGTLRTVRAIGAKHAPAYLGMCRAVFDETVRPDVREFPIGKQGVAFDHHELDEWADAYIERMAIEKQSNQDNNPPRSGRQGAKQWREK